MKSSGPNGRQGAAGARRLAGLTAGLPGSRKGAGGQRATDRTRGTELGARRPQVSTSPQARAWQPSPPAARSWPPTTTTGAAWAPLPVTAPAEVPSTRGKPSPTTRVSPKQIQDTGGLAFSSESPLSHSWPQCWSTQSTRSLPRPPPARSPVTWLGKLWGSSSPAASLAKPTAGPHPE